jgi:hypothetical protein
LRSHGGWVVLVAVLGPRGEDYRRGETKKVKSHSLLAPIGVLGDISIYKYVYTVYIYIYIIILYNMQML